jgi:hypothetical protein
VQETGFLLHKNPVSSALTDKDTRLQEREEIMILFLTILLLLLLALLAVSQMVADR